MKAKRFQNAKFTMVVSSKPNTRAQKRCFKSMDSASLIVQQRSSTGMMTTLHPILISIISTIKRSKSRLKRYLIPTTYLRFNKTILFSEGVLALNLTFIQEDFIKITDHLP